MRRKTVALALGLWAATVLGQPYVPVRDDEVLESIPVPDRERRELRDLREEVKRHPDQRDLAITLSLRYIQLGRRNADPRYYGYAESVLSPWLAASDPEALILRATVRQNRHDFQNALSDLDTVRKVNPRLGQAWLSRAAILEVQGDYPGAVHACMAFSRLTNSPSGMVCLESALSLAGQARSAYRNLARLVSSTEMEADDLIWSRVILGEMAERINLPEEAETWYRQALKSGPRSIYMLSTYADFLLDRNRPLEVIGLLENETRADPLLLRLTLAEKRLHHPRYAEHFAALKSRFEASRARGDASHQGDEARFALYLAENPEQALTLALANWSVQREPRDARILLEAAKAAGRPDAARPVEEFLVRSRLEDARLSNLIFNPGKRRS